MQGKNIPKQEAEKFILTVDDVAHMLGISRMAVYLMIRRHGLPARKLKKRIFFHKGELEQWLLSRPLANKEKA